jgi:hypothetical protein
MGPIIVVMKSDKKVGGLSLPNELRDRFAYGERSRLLKRPEAIGDMSGAPAIQWPYGRP